MMLQDPRRYVVDGCQRGILDGLFSSSKPHFSMDQVVQFKKNFMNLYRGRGGKIKTPNPTIIDGVPDIADAIQKTFRAARNRVHTRMDVTQPSTEPNYRILPAYRYGGSTGDEEDDPSMVTSDHESGTRRSKTSEDAEEVENGSNSDSEGCSKKIARSSICPSRLNRDCFSNVSLCMSASEHGPGGNKKR